MITTRGFILFGAAVALAASAQTFFTMLVIG